MWSLILLASVCFDSYFIIENIFDYSKYESITSINIINEEQTIFPAISFCGNPSLDKQTINELILKIRFNRLSINEINFSNYFEIFNNSVFGKCFRFNSGHPNKSLDILNYSVITGETNGLRIDWNLKVPDGYDFVELLVNVHNQTVPPFNLHINNWLVN